MSKLTIKSLLFLGLSFPTLSFAYDVTPSEKMLYLTANGGVAQNTFNVKYGDQNDVIPQNIAVSALQKSYTGGLGIGFSKIYCQSYLLGLELSGGWISNYALYQSGAAVSAFTDKITLQNYIDIVVVPGVLFTNSLAGYLKIGASAGHFIDKINTPVGYNPTFKNVQSSDYNIGFTGSLGVKKWLTPFLALFAEYNYRDYGTVPFSNFQNFTANYSHKTKAFGENILLGLTYQFF